MSTQLNTNVSLGRNRQKAAAGMIPAALVAVCATLAGPSANAQTYTNQRVDASQFLPGAKQQQNSQGRHRSTIVKKPSINTKPNRDHRHRSHSTNPGRGRYIDQSDWRVPSTIINPVKQQHPARKHPSDSRRLDQSNWRAPATDFNFPAGGGRTNRTRASREQFSNTRVEDLRFQDRYSRSTTHDNGAKSRVSTGAGIDTTTDARVGAWMEGGERFAGVRGQVRSGGSATGRTSQTGRIGNTEMESFVEGEAFVGGQADAQAGISRDGARMGGGAFVGGRVGGRTGTRIGSVEGAVTGEGWSGVGAEADVNIGFKGGKLKIGGGIGGALGVGAKVGGEVTIPVEKIGKDIGKGAKKVGKDIGKAFGSIF